MRKNYILAIALFFVLALKAAPGIYYVKSIATGVGDGSSWANASANIQAMVDAAFNNPEKGEVQIAAGTYLLTTSINVKDGVNITGGYATDGSGTRDLAASQTILDGQNQTRLITSAETDPAITKVVYIDGLVLQRGASDNGSAVLISLGVTLRNCIIRNNNGGTFGAAVCMKKITSIASPTVGYNQGSAIVNCIIINNTSTSGAGGLYCEGGAYFSLFNTVIANNLCSDATGAGGLFFGSGIRWSGIINNIFSNNLGGGDEINNNMVNTSATSIGTALKGLKNNWFDNTAIPISDPSFLDAAACTGNLTKTEVATPDFELPTTFIGYNTAKMTEIAASNWRLKIGSALLDKGVSSQAANYPFSSAIYGGVSIPYTTLLPTDIAGSPRISNLLPDMGAYELQVASGVNRLNDDLIKIQILNHSVKVVGDYQKIQIYNLQGSNVYSSINNNQTIQLNNAGIYIVKVISNNGLGIRKFEIR